MNNSSLEQFLLDLSNDNYTMVELPTIPEFYRNKNIFITGGTGFIGKVLIEKLLRSCPDLNNIYLLMREKKNRSPEERIKAITDVALFDLLKSQNANSLEKIKFVTGDVRELQLGLSDPERKLLTEEINIVFHIAASVRFDDSLTDAVILNTRGTREVVQLALNMKNLDVLVHISTTYCNTDRETIEEKIYPPHADWKKTIEIAENVDRHTLNVLTEKYIHPLPNTYTFTKSLGEHVVNDLCKGKIPAVIYRPSIVISSAHEPIPGWMDNFNGPIGVLVASGKGIIRTIYSNPDVISDYVPVDMTVKAIIIASWKQGTHRDRNRKLTPEVYNGSKSDKQPITLNDMVDLGKDICVDVPFDDVLWYPNGSITKCYYYYFLKVIFYQLLPALLIDGLLKILGKKPMLIKLQRRIYVATMAIAYFSHNQWQFINEKVMKMKNDLLPSDVDSFSFKEDTVEVYDYFKKGTMGARKYLLHEGEDLEKAKKHSKRMWILAQITNFLWYCALLWLVFIKIDIFSLITNACNRSVLYLTTD